MPEILEKMENVLLKLHTRIIVNRKKSKKKNSPRRNEKRKRKQKTETCAKKLMKQLNCKLSLMYEYYHITILFQEI
jgi:predicted solute-binding protein